MGKLELDKKRQEFIIDSGDYFEQSGLTRVSGQIIGLLMVSPKPKMTMGEITKTLQVSKSSTSTSLKLLTQVGFMKKTSKLGDRKDYYEMDPEIWQKGFITKLQATTSFMYLIDQAREVIGLEMTEQRIMLEEMHAMYEFFSHELVELNKKWEIEREKLMKRLNKERIKVTTK